ncbi:MAG: hypothetical protein ACP5OO_05875 [Chloroflexia bacterium]
MSFWKNGPAVWITGLLLVSLLPAACGGGRPAFSETPAKAPTLLSLEPSPPAADLWLAPGDVLVYPGPERYSGDILSFDVTPRNIGSIPPSAIALRLYHRTNGQREVIAEGSVGFPAYDGQPRARLIWAWDTHGLVGEQTLVAWLDPDDLIQEGDEDPTNNLLTFTLYLSPAVELPPPERGAAWMTETTACCTLHYLSGSAAARDMSTITVAVEEAFAGVAGRLGVSSPEPLEIYFLSRVIGQGGYAYGQVAVSYLDRHYAGLDLRLVLRHEIVHVLDARLFQVYPPALLREGLAVYLSGGHYKEEPIPRRAAALLPTGRYIPLETLAGDFYAQQHEVAYLEGAALIAYLVDTYGWEHFLRFYASFEKDLDPVPALEQALEENFGRGREETEEAFRAWLEAHPPTSEQVRDLEDTVRLFEAMRRYQERYDPGAYWWSGWMPDPAEGEERGIVADFIRHPRAPENLALEAMLIAAQESLRAGRLTQAEALLDGIERVLESGAFSGRPEADYLALVEAAQKAGYEVQRISLDGGQATVWAVARWPHLEKLTFQRTASGWTPVAVGR